MAAALRHPATAQSPADRLDRMADLYLARGDEVSKLTADALRRQAERYRSVTFRHHDPIGCEEFLDRLSAIDAEYDRGYADGLKALAFDRIEF